MTEPTSIEKRSDWPHWAETTTYEDLGKRQRTWVEIPSGRTLTTADDEQPEGAR